MASIRKQLLVLFLVGLLSSTGLVTSFSISKHRSERNTDLAEALAILQRQRRRVGVEDFLNSERLLQERPLTLEDVSDWLSRSNEDEVEDDVMENGRVDSWMPSEAGSFKDFDFSDGEAYVSPIEPTAPTRIKASEDEIKDIFGTDEGVQQDGGKLEKKVKEELVNPKGDAQQGKRADSTGDNRNVLNSLTDEEIRVLVKAVGKLQNREGDAEKVKKSPEFSELSVKSDALSSAQNGDQVIISEPVSQEELKSVFKETNGPVSKETIVVEHKVPGQETPEVIEQEILSEQLPDDSTIVRERELTNLLPQVIEREIEAEQEAEENEAAAEEAAEEEVAAEVVEAEKLQWEAEEAEEQEKEADEIAAEIENISTERLSPEIISKYLSMKHDKLYSAHRGMAKRTAKRASGFDSGNRVLSADDVRSFIGDVDFETLDKSLIQAFVLKILTLQSEIDALKFKNSLEDLENDELTDALNEATMGQREGSVSNQEWSSLQHAIEIEQALQDLKKKETGQDLAMTVSGDDDKRKRGEPWKRSRDNMEDDDIYSGAIASRSSLLQDFDDEGNADIERLLKSSYLMKSDDEDEEGDEIRDDETLGGDEDEPVASLFLSHADQCPAIRMYSNNCELADVYNLPVDFEARALCNLHEMCYACGHSLSVSQTQCDLVYRAAVSSLCHQKEVCVAESEIFLRTMKLKTRFIPYVQPSCRSRCTAQFMGMF